MEYIASATLGYITANVPGAVIGYQVAKKLSENSRNRMPPIPNKKRKRTVSSSTVKRKSRKLASKLRRTPRTAVAVNAQAPKVIGRRRGAKKSPAVRVTRDFRQKVQKVLEKNLVEGKLIAINTQVIRNSTDNGQTATYLGEHFSPNFILDAASVLWNKKTWTEGNKLPYDANNFNWQTARVHVMNCYDQYTFRNNSRRTVTLKLFECKPKVKTNAFHPLEQWSNTLAAENNPNESNIAGTTVNTLYNDPRNVKSWSQIWSPQVTTIVMEPGQTYVHKLQGPKNQMLDFAKFVVNNAPQVFMDQQPFARYMLAISYVDLVTTTLSATGRYVDASGEAYDGIAFEIKRVYNLAMPEQAGLELPVTYSGGIKSLGYRRYSFAIYNDSDAQTGFVRRIDDENPITVETDL